MDKLTKDICKTWIKNSLGLRHVAGRRQAEVEKTDGAYGDALAIGSCYLLIEGKDSALVKHADTALEVIDHLNGYELEQWLESVESAVKNFIVDCIKLDILGTIGPHDTVATILAKLRMTEPCFLLCQLKHGDAGYDTDHYYGLGKCGDQPITAAAIKGYVSAPDPDLTTSDLDSTALATDEAVRKIMNAAAEQILNKLITLSESI